MKDLASKEGAATPGPLGLDLVKTAIDGLKHPTAVAEIVGLAVDTGE